MRQKRGGKKGGEKKTQSPSTGYESSGGSPTNIIHGWGRPDNVVNRNGKP